MEIVSKKMCGRFDCGGSEQAYVIAGLIGKQLGAKESQSATLRVGRASYQQKLVKPMEPYKLSISLTWSCQKLFIFF